MGWDRNRNGEYVRPERTGWRDLTFYRWHRTLHPSLHLIDIDGVEYCPNCKEPLALFELVRDKGQVIKPTLLMRKLAARAELPAYLVFYTPGWGPDKLLCLRMRQVWPERSLELRYTPEGFEDWLLSLRRQHRCSDDGRHPKSTTQPQRPMQLRLLPPDDAGNKNPRRRNGGGPGW